MVDFNDINVGDYVVFKPYAECNFHEYITSNMREKLDSGIRFVVKKLIDGTYGREKQLNIEGDICNYLISWVERVEPRPHPVPGTRVILKSLADARKASSGGIIPSMEKYFGTQVTYERDDGYEPNAFRISEDNHNCYWKYAWVETFIEEEEIESPSVEDMLAFITGSWKEEVNGNV